jgi:hypothetical protein
MIISMHSPKAGGSSFRNLLKKEFGLFFREDYGDLPIIKSLENRSRDAEAHRRRVRLYKWRLLQLTNVQCIHGHFLPYKYLDLVDKPKVHFVTWLRDPLERMASHYYYWQRTYKGKKSHHLHQQVMEEKWTLEDFCLSSRFRNIYSQYLYQFPIEHFDFIGITEFFDEDLAYFSKKFLNKREIEAPTSNTNPNKGNKPYISDPDLISKIKEFHSEDYAIYEYGLQHRANRED